MAAWVVSSMTRAYLNLGSGFRRVPACSGVFRPVPGWFRPFPAGSRPSCCRAVVRRAVGRARTRRTFPQICGSRTTLGRPRAYGAELLLHVEKKSETAHTRSVRLSAGKPDTTPRANRTYVPKNLL